MKPHSNSGLVRGEVWRSLVSLLRSYSGAAGLNHSGHSAREAPAGSLILSYKNAVLEVCFRTETGNGSWKLSRGGSLLAEGHFRIAADGTLTVCGDAPWELDQAAVDWVARLTGAGAAPAMPVTRSTGAG